MRPYLAGRVLDFGSGVGWLAPLCAHDSYLGVERDAECLRVARSRYPRHHFQEELPSSGRFETIAALAVVEHLKKPDEVVRVLARLLAPAGRIVLTTPHPSFRGIHDFGARIGLFNPEAAEEHETFLDRQSINKICEREGLTLVEYRRFLLRANQLFVLARAA